MTQGDRGILETFARRVREVLPAARIWAFGSRAYGTPSPDSDLDVCVVVDHLDEHVDSKIMGLAWEVGFDNDIVISTVTYSTQEFERGPLSESGLVRAVLRQGVAA